MATTPQALSSAERVQGLSLIWLEARRNFPIPERLAALDARYLAALPEVAGAADLRSYYRQLQMFIAGLQDGHSFIVLPKGMQVTASRPPLGLRRVGELGMVDWVRSDLLAQIPLGSVVEQVDDEPLIQAAVRARATVSASTAHVREDEAFRLALEGPRDGTLRLRVRTPEG